MAWVNPWLMVFRHLPRVPNYSVVVNLFTASTGIRTPIAAVKIKHADHYTICHAEASIKTGSQHTHTNTPPLNSTVKHYQFTIAQGTGLMTICNPSDFRWKSIYNIDKGGREHFNITDKM